MKSTRIILKSGKDQSLRKYHPWVFSGAIKKIKGNTPAEGDIVEVYDNKDEFLGKGHYQKGTIAIRILSFKEVAIDSIFWKTKIEEACNLRKMLGLLHSTETNVFRLINAEGDGLPGLIVDYYNGFGVIQLHSVGMYRNLAFIAEAIKETLGESLTGLYNKSVLTLPYKADIEKENYYLYGDVSGNEVKEHDLLFKVNWEEGQKTGFYVDQRENRYMVKQLAKDRKVLNLFGYTGGFSVYALAGDCERVDTLDSSAKAIELADQNVELNFTEKHKHKGIVADAFSFLKEMKDDYGLIVLDPPAFAKHNNVLSNALQGYKRLNRLAMEKIAQGGVLFTFSCSQVVSTENFRKMVFAASASAGRNVKVLYQLTQPADHPISIFHPEGEYLKGLVLQIN
ncbi:MAG: class I SAM-dependent rRNA methyltransferase [Bacteroidales bacterium]